MFVILQEIVSILAMRMTCQAYEEGGLSVPKSHDKEETIVFEVFNTVKFPQTMLQQK